MLFALLKRLVEEIESLLFCCHSPAIHENGMDEEALLDFQANEIEFYGFIRKHLICLLLFVFLYLISFSIIRFLKTRSDNDELYAGDEDFFVYRVSIWMCSCSLAVSIGAVTLLPFSVLGSEVLHIYPDNFYLKWLNWSLIHSLWNYVFLLSNLSMFVLLPFAYFFIESQGFSFTLQLQPRPLLARVYETLIVCFLVIVLLVGITDVFYSLVLSENYSLSLSVLYVTSLSTPLLYSCVSLCGVFLLLISTPLGFAKMFDLFSDSLISRNSGSSSRGGEGEDDNRRNGTPPSSGNNNFAALASTAERLQAMSCIRKQAMQEPNGVKQRLQRSSHHNGWSNGHAGGGGGGFPAAKSAATMEIPFYSPVKREEVDVGYGTSGSMPSSSTLRLGRSWMPRVRVKDHLRRLGCLPAWNSLKYPIMMLILLVLTTLSVSMVLINTLQLLFGFRALPEYVQYVEVHSRHTFGIIGALVENTIILYVMLAALVGIYSIPLLRRMRPRRGKTSMTSIIANCATVLLLSSALPVLARTLGITSIDLLGAYGSLNWISNFSLVWSYNVLFAVATIFCLVNKFTLPVRRELLRRLCSLTRRKNSIHSMDQNAMDQSEAGKTQKID